MERDSSKHSEFNPVSSEPESDSSSETDKKKKKKTQSDDVSVWSRINSVETKPDNSTPKTAERLGTLWRHETEKTKEVESRDLTPESESGDKDQLEHLSQSEVKEVAEAYVTARRQEIAHELTEQTGEDTEDQTDAQAALAADTYLAAVENKLKAEPEADISQATDAAYAETVRDFAPETADMSVDEKTLRPELEDNGDGDDGGEPPSWRAGTFSPGDRHSFGVGSAANTSGNLETIIEHDFAAERVAAVRGLLVGGIIGYLIGRRRGRIKTEKRLIPVQQKLEREVESLYNTIAAGETQLRKVVQQRDRSRELNRSAGITSETSKLDYSNQNFEQTFKTDKIRSPETIKPPSSNVEIVNRENLLKASEKITIGTTTLRKVFETGLISERGLRRAVEEYSKGGDIRRVLAEEVLIKELGYELDPLLRDRPLTKPTEPLAGPLKQEPASHAQAVATIGEQVVTPNQSSENPVPSPLPVSQRTVPPLLITANVLALVVLAVLLIILLITHK